MRKFDAKLAHPLITVFLYFKYSIRPLINFNLLMMSLKLSISSEHFKNLLIIKVNNLGIAPSFRSCIESGGVALKISKSLSSVNACSVIIPKLFLNLRSLKFFFVFL